MKHCKRLLAMVLALGLFSACGAAPASSASASSAAASAEAAEATDTPDATAAAVEPSAQEAVSAELSEAEPEENVVQREECELPLYDGESFTYWTVLQGMDEPNDSFLFWNQLADATGVTIEFVNAPEETAMEKYNLMMATGDCTDVIYERGLTTGTSSSCPYSGGYAKAMWCGDQACEDEIKDRFSASSRCMPFDQTPIGETCVCCGKPAKKVIYFAKAY